MRIALVTTPPSRRSGIGDYTRHLLPHLRAHADVDLYVPPPVDANTWPGDVARSVLELDPNAYDQVLFQLGNELGHNFMARMIRRIGGTVMQHDWVLFDMALATYPGLVRGGWKGHLLALREGGWDQARLYMHNWLERRRERNNPAELPEISGLIGQLLAGWHDAEPAGRWIADRAVFRIPADHVTRVEVLLSSEPGRELSLTGQDVTAHFTCSQNERGTQLGIDLGLCNEPTCELNVSNIVVTQEQRGHGDSRRLGAFIQNVSWVDKTGRHELDLSLPASSPMRPIDLSRNRFDLPLNRSVVDHADAFIVHSEYVGSRIRARRSAGLPMGVLPHGAARRWNPDEAPGERGARQVLRTKLGLPAEWNEGFLVISFGGVQPHKRIGRVFAGLSKAREERKDIYLVLVGGWHPGEFDPPGLARVHGVEKAVHITGYVPEEEAWDWIAAGDVSINLRGPTSGGTSGGIYQALAFGRGVIATDAAEQAELPDECTPKVPLGGEAETDAIGRLLVELASHPDKHAAVEAAARRYVDQECAWDLVGEAYVKHMKHFPAPRPSPRKLDLMRSELIEFFDQAGD